jgi:Flp pilus assembly protein CpaB
MAISAPARQTKAKPAARRSLFLIGIAMSVVAFLLVLVLGSFVASRAVAGTVQVSVLVAARDIHHRQMLTAADLGTTPVPVSAVPPQALLQTGQAVNRVAQVDVLKGQPITANLIAAEGSGDPGFLPIPPGWVATAIPDSEQQGIAGYVASGDVIDVTASVSEAVLYPAAANPRQLTRTVFPGLHVVNVGPSTGGKAGQRLGLSSSLTVLVTSCDQPYLTWLLQNTALRYALRASADYGAVPIAADASCPVGTASSPVGPVQVDRKFSFTKV